MGRNTDEFDDQIKGQISIDDLFAPPERLFAVSRIFARARKKMNLIEQKTFVCALSQLDFTKVPKENYVMIDKKVLANVLGIHSDTDHLSVDIYNEIKDIDKHSHIEISDNDKDFNAAGGVITTVVRFKNKFRIRFNEDFLPLFTNLSTDYITMWSSDIFGMSSIRSVQFYELLRQLTDTRESINQHGWSVTRIKEMFDIPKEGKGSYMRTKGGFDRTNFEKYVIDPLCDDLKKCKMLNLVMQSDGKLYEKVKKGNRVQGYRFYWTISKHPAVASAEEVRKIQKRVDDNAEVLKIAKDLINGKKSKKKADFEQNAYDYDALEKDLRKN